MLNKFRKNITSATFDQFSLLKTSNIILIFILFLFLASIKYFFPPTISGSAIKIVNANANIAPILIPIPSPTWFILNDFTASHILNIYFCDFVTLFILASIACAIFS